MKRNGEDVYLDDIVQAILTADTTDLEDILYWIKRRYAELFPDWEFHMISLEKKGDRIQQIDCIIAILEQFKLEE